MVLLPQTDTPPPTTTYNHLAVSTQSQQELTPAQKTQSGPSAKVHYTPPPVLPAYEDDIGHWNCSQQQRIWMQRRCNPWVCGRVLHLSPSEEHQQEGYHFHLAQWVTVSGTGHDRCGSVELSMSGGPDGPGADTGETFGLEYAEPQTRPVPLNWDKHKSRSAPTETPHPLSSPLTPRSELPPPMPETPARIFQFCSQLSESPVEDQTVQPQTKIEFFQRELEGTQKRTEEKKQLKRKRTETAVPAGRKCLFCKLSLKQGPDSPQIHTNFPGVVGKYIYCPGKVFSLHRGMRIGDVLEQP
ncbi:hypothetical protein FQA47_005424 [Oryzias melastigma]|uniref:Uncharacterized protein n=1 Tax=Oryzias melastigma TaxID=30732 RepID=A0A834BU29_ORYME|nr:hypothetical protein FQA47_005424 [Oryzias melastigma]